MRPFAMRLVGTALLLCAPIALDAQASGALPRTPPTKIISVNPFLPLAGYFQAEFEAKVRDNLAVAVAGSYTELDDRYTNADVKLRLYPQERGLEGFAIAAGVGFGRISNNDESLCVAGACRDWRRSTSGPTFSVETHYQ